jgi:hypothetical protein
VIPVSWTESGLFFATWRDMLKDATSVSLVDTNNNLALVSNTETPDYISATDPSTWTTTNEVTGTNWSSGGINLSTGSYGPTVTQSPSKTLMWDMTNNVAVASTTITGAYGCYIYANGLSPKAKIIGVWFGGTGYSTVAGTFAITWNTLGVATIQMAA